MVDEEVENILAEIRESVRARRLPAPEIAAPRAQTGDEPFVFPAEPHEAVASVGGDALARLDSYLAVTARAWDRLPPLVSNRSGSLARIELWIKGQLKRVTHWFTWEQINFNAAVHHALRDSLEALSSYAHALEKLRTETEAQRLLNEQNQARLQALLLKQREEIHAQGEDLLAQREALETQLGDVETQRAAQVAAQRREMDARLSVITREMRERFEHLQDEQRVCFKQLSLEATEAAVLEDRARRKAEMMIEEFRSRLGQLETSDKL